MSNKNTDSNNFSNDDFDIVDIDYNLVKIDLDKNLFKGPYYEFLNYSMEDAISDDNKQESITKIEEEMNQKEQIDEIKINMFFIVHLGCDYNNEYMQVINEENYILAKRLVIQNYSINSDLITFGKKRYIFIQRKSETGKFNFRYGNKEIIIEKKSGKKITMAINNKLLETGEEFIKYNKQKKDIKNIELLKKPKKGAISNTDSINNEIKEDNLSDSKLMSLAKLEGDKNNKFETIQSSSSSRNKDKDNSEKELKGTTFFDENSRYIFLDNYKKKIDGIYTQHNEICLKKGKKKLEEGLKDLLDNIYDKNNDIQSHIIFKNFKEDSINKNEPFILEVKKSMAGLADLFRRIKDISKVVHNLQGGRLPKYIIGIICSYSEKQIKYYQIDSNSEVKKILTYAMDIINDNNVNVLIGVIKDEKIYGYDLGKPDYEQNGLRVDIHYMNKFFGKLGENQIEQIYKKYSGKYLSLTFTKNQKLNYSKLDEKHQITLNDYKKLQAQIKKNNQRLKKSEDEKNLLLNFIQKQLGKELTFEEISQMMNKGK